jgi:restriction system protein
MNHASHSEPDPQDFRGIVSVLPWWIGVMLALVSYVVLSRVAADVLEDGSQVWQIGAALHEVVGPLMILAGQYLLPALCLVMAVASLHARHQRRLALAQAAASPASAQGPRLLEGMGWVEFKALMCEGFLLRGYRVTGGSPDPREEGGYLRLERDGVSYHVACRYWKQPAVDARSVRELHQALLKQGIPCDFMLSAGRFSTEARAYAASHDIKPVDGLALHLMIRQARAVRSQAAAMAQAAEPLSWHTPR